MKLCITTTGRDLDSSVDERFGRASYFLIIDTETMKFEAVRNTAQTAGRGAGIGAAQIISDKGADALLTGVVGPNAFAALKAANIKIYEGASGADSVRDAVEKFKNGEYKEASAPSGGTGYGWGRGRGLGYGRGRGKW
ncbi:MAG: NifB/NifX family molybdenum-iron cluster-binding protein [Nitrospirota bacterium]